MKKEFSLIQKLGALLTLATLFSPIFSIGAGAQTMPKTKLKALSEEQKILHVLNRLGFGAREGDVEKVRAAGLDKYIERQLNPNAIDDAVAESKLKNLDVLKMSNDEIFAKYPANAAVLQLVAQKNGLKRQDVQGIVRKRNNNDESKDAAKEAGNAETNAAERREYQRQITDVYREKKLGRPPQITQQLTASRILRAVYSEKQLNEQMVDFWTNHFNVFSGKAVTRWFLPEYDRDVIRPNALGNFKDLLLATAKSPAMLFYLDNFQSVSPDMQANRRANRRNQTAQNAAQPTAQRRAELKRKYNLSDAELDARLKQNRQNQKQGQKNKRGINENYAREVMELHTLGVEGGYMQKDIQEVARAFTGWTIVDPRGHRKAAGLIGDEKQASGMKGLMRLAGLPPDAPSGTFYFNERAHDHGEKIALGQKINEGGIKDGLKVIDVLVNHPSTAKFIARKLAVKFVSDNPSEALVSRVADAFHRSKGDIKTTLRALFTDKEFFAPENYRAKIKTPFELLVSAIRTVGAETNGIAVQTMLAKMGEPLYGFQAPTGYPDTAEDWVNTGALPERLNFSVALVSNRIPGTRVNLSKFEDKDKSRILDRAAKAILNGEISPNTKTTLLKQLEKPLPEPKITTGVEETEDPAIMIPDSGRRGQNRQARLLAPTGNPEVFKVVGLILGTPEFQRQ